MPQVRITCHRCGKSFEFEDRLTRNATCDSCSSYLRCCLNCQFYDPVSYNECREPQADRVKEKDKATYCEYFQPNAGSVVAKSKKNEEALKKLNDLFKK